MISCQFLYINMTIINNTAGKGSFNVIFILLLIARELYSIDTELVHTQQSERLELKPLTRL